MKGWNKEEIKETKEENNRIIMSSGSGGSGSSGSSESSSSDSNNNIIMLKNNNNNNNNNDIEKDNGNNYDNDNDNYDNNNSNDAMVVVAANAKPGSIIITLEEDLSNQIIIENNNKTHQSTRSIMRDKKKLDTYDLAEDVYAFIFVSPIMSVPFFFSLYVIAVKIIIYSILISDINFSNVTGGSKTATAAKFFLIPVALSMQTDLMHSFFCMANITYCPSVLKKISKSATQNKLIFSFLLRTIDGLFSLSVNFALMIVTDTTLSVFTNFAALYFLQDIDDVFYGLVELGFFGDKMEHMSTICKSVCFPRRTGIDNEKHYCGFLNLRISHLDTIMFVLVFIILLILYTIFVIAIYENFGGFNQI